MAEDQAEDREREDTAAEMREAAVFSAVSSAVGIGLQLAIMGVILKRDWLWRQWRRYQWYVLREWRGSHYRGLLAELRRDLTLISHTELHDGD